MYDVYGNLLIGAKQKDGSILKRNAAESFAVKNLVPLPTLSMKAVCGKTFRRENVRSNGIAIRIHENRLLQRDSRQTEYCNVGGFFLNFLFSRIFLYPHEKSGYHLGTKASKSAFLESHKKVIITMFIQI